MAKVTGKLELKGTIGSITFRQTQDGTIASSKSSLDRKKFLHHPSFEKSRHAAQTFKKASACAKYLRRAVMAVLSGHIDNRLTPRLNAAFIRLFMQDPANDPANRRLHLPYLTQLVGFECNARRHLAAILPVTPQIQKDLQENKLSVILPFHTAQLNTPFGTTHITITCALVNLDFEKQRDYTCIPQFLTLATETQDRENVQFDFDLAPHQHPAILVILAIGCYIRSEDKMFPLFPADNNASGIIYATQL